jgi:hypothetical protein
MANNKFFKAGDDFAIPASSSVAIASDGEVLDLNSLAQTLNYNGNNKT